MSEPVYYIIFASSASDECTNTELLKLLEKCRQNNLKRNITGLLLHYQGSFIEIIEGRKKLINWLFENKILHDPRHYGVIKLISGYADNRSFPDWSMGFKRIEKGLIEKEIPNFNKILETHTDPIKAFPGIAKPLLIFIRSFYKSSGYSP
jgi:hypothetical protein